MKKGLELVREFTFQGFQACIIRVEWSGHLNGYVKIPTDHRLFGMGYSDDKFPDLHVHGGITYAGEMENPDEWWIGFDCAHYDDPMPNNPAQFKSTTATYKDEYFVVREIMNLVEQVEWEGFPWWKKVLLWAYRYRIK